MSKWTLNRVTDTGKGRWFMDDEDGDIPAMVMGEREVAEQIVREHNAHAELVLCLKAMLKITCGECLGEGVWEYWKCRADPDKPDCALSARARAAIEAAEGDGR